MATKVTRYVVHGLATGAADGTSESDAWPDIATAIAALSSAYPSGYVVADVQVDLICSNPSDTTEIANTLVLETNGQNTDCFLHLKTSGANRYKLHGDSTTATNVLQGNSGTGPIKIGRGFTISKAFFNGSSNNRQVIEVRKSNFEVDGLIAFPTTSNSGTGKVSGFGLRSFSGASLLLTNSVLYGFGDSASGEGISHEVIGGSSIESINNTYINCGTAIFGTTGDKSRNDIFQSNATDISGATDVDYALTDDASITGANSVTSSTLTFADSANDDYSLDASDTDAIGAGIGPSADADIPTLDAAGNARSGATTDIGAYVYSAGGDVTAPVLSSPTGTKTGQTTASGTVSTDEGNGTLYFYASTNSSESAATIKASGSSQAVSGTGSQSVSFTGLTAATTYYAHYVHDDSSANTSNVVSSSSFTTDASIAIDTEPTELKVGVAPVFVVSGPATTPTTGNTTGNFTGLTGIAPTSVTGSDPYTITFPAISRTVAKQFSEAGIVWDIDINAESVSSSAIPYRPATGYAYVTFGTINTSSEFYTDYSGATLATSQQGVYGTSTDPQGRTFTLFDTADYELSSAITQDNTVPFYTIQTDGTVGPEDTVTLDYAAPDLTAPVITLIGSSTVNVEQGGTYTELGATATDNVDGSVSVTVGGDTVDPNTAGTYTVTYNAVDGAGNNATQVTRTVTVADTTAPVIALNGSAIVNVPLDGTYTELGATWTDAVDGSGAASVGGDTVNTSAEGVYTVTYSRTDAAGNVATPVSRTVNVYIPGSNALGWLRSTVKSVTKGLSRAITR